MQRRRPLPCLNPTPYTLHPQPKPSFTTCVTAHRQTVDAMTAPITVPKPCTLYPKPKPSFTIYFTTCVIAHRQLVDAETALSILLSMLLRVFTIYFTTCVRVLLHTDKQWMQRRRPLPCGAGRETTRASSSPLSTTTALSTGSNTRSKE